MAAEKSMAQAITQVAIKAIMAGREADKPVKSAMLLDTKPRPQCQALRHANI